MYFLLHDMDIVLVRKGEHGKKQQQIHSLSSQQTKGKPLLPTPPQLYL